jgi:hypothetical protein
MSSTLRLLAVFGLFLVPVTARSQSPDTTKPPPVVHAAGPFTARQLLGLPSIDGQSWIPVEVHTGRAPATFRAPNGSFSLMLADTGIDTGDFQRYKLLFQRGSGAAVRIDDGFTGWVYVTPDSRYIVTEPLYVLDVERWKQYALSESLGIENYTSIEAISADGRRLFISRRDCAVDCGNQRVDYYELTVP